MGFYKEVKLSYTPALEDSIEQPEKEDQMQTLTRFFQGAKISYNLQDELEKTQFGHPA